MQDRPLERPAVDGLQVLRNRYLAGMYLPFVHVRCILIFWHEMTEKSACLKTDHKTSYTAAAPRPPDWRGGGSRFGYAHGDWKSKSDITSAPSPSAFASSLLAVLR